MVSQPDDPVRNGGRDAEGERPQRARNRGSTTDQCTPQARQEQDDAGNGEQETAAAYRYQRLNQEPQDRRSEVDGLRCVAKVYVDPHRANLQQHASQPLINYLAVFDKTVGECPTAVKGKPV